MRETGPSVPRKDEMFDGSSNVGKILSTRGYFRGSDFFMIGHQVKGVNGHPAGFGGVFQLVQIGRIILLGKESRLAVVASPKSWAG